MRQIALVLATLCAATSLPVAQSWSWSAQQANCQPAMVEYDLSCGDLGTFSFSLEEITETCVEASGDFDPLPYPQSPQVVPFHHALYSFDQLVAQDPFAENVLTIDLQSDEHAASVSWLAQAAAGPLTRGSVLSLGDPRFAALGAHPSDLHVLAALCTVLDHVDDDVIAPPVVINMPFGRGLLPSDAGDAACDPNEFTCQIARVVDELNDRGSLISASAGNYQDKLFPGSLSGVIHVGMMDENSLLTNVAPTASWESPAPLDAIIPGSALCIDGSWSAPSGSSYASALYAGWITATMRQYPGLDPSAQTLQADLVPRLGCFRLTDGQTNYDCNPVATQMFRYWFPSQVNPCKASSYTTSKSVSLGSQTTQPSIPSLTQHTIETHDPTPSADPCIPCDGAINQTSLEIDLSDSLGVPGFVIDSVDLRVGTTFYDLMVLPTTLDQIQQGALDQLILNGAGSLVSTNESASLVWKVHPTSQANCAGSCYQVFSPILITP